MSMEKTNSDLGLLTPLVFTNGSNIPEIIIFGLPPDTMQALINEVGENIRDGVQHGAGKERTIS